MDLYEELRAIAGALEAAHVRYALVGGLAVSIYATPRATEDIDRLVRDLGGRPVAVLGVSGLRTLKRLRRSAQDLADLEALGPEGQSEPPP